MAILLTGGTGFIGSHTAVALLEAGYEVVIIDNLSNSKLSVVDAIKTITKKSVQLYVGDIGDTHLLEQIFEKHTIDAVFHFAAKKSVGESCAHPWDYYENNIHGLVTLTDAMKKYGCCKFLFSSSCTVYDPEASEAPFDEASPTGNCFSPYGTTKYVAELLLRDLSLHQGFSVCNLRYFNPIGAHASGSIGEDAAQPPTNLLPVIFQVIQGKRKILQIFGDRYETADGTCLRDYIHVVDLAQAHVAAGDWLLKNTEPCCEAFNIGTGTPTSVKELIAIVEKVTTHQVSVEIVAPREGDIPIAYANPEKAKRVLGWQATLTVDEAVRDGWNFINASF